METKGPQKHREDGRLRPHGLLVIADPVKTRTLWRVPTLRHVEQVLPVHLHPPELANNKQVPRQPHPRNDHALPCKA